MDDLIIRKLEEKDLEELSLLYKQFWNEESNIRKMREKYQKIKNNPNYVILSAVINGKNVGSIYGVVCEELYGSCKPFLLMEDLIVDKNVRRKGIGNEKKCSQIIFITETNRVDAVSFYEKMGFNSKTHTGFKKQLN
jgi:GNAT superfamily N-acetyltransferase